MEDEFFIALQMADLISEMGFHVVGPVGSVDDAIDALSREAVHGALLDVNVGSGHIAPVAEKLAAEGTPFILTTGYDKTVIPAALRSRPWLQKPVDERGLRNAIASTFGLPAASVPAA